MLVTLAKFLHQDLFTLKLLPYSELLIYEQLVPVVDKEVFNV